MTDEVDAAGQCILDLIRLAALGTFPKGEGNGECGRQRRAEDAALCHPERGEGSSRLFTA